MNDNDKASGKRVLICDDEPDFRAFVRRVAEGLGHQAFEVEAPGRFAQAYREAAPETIVLDIVMPEIDGLELVNWLGENGYRGHLLLVTGYNPSYAKAARTMADLKGIASVAVLQKPVALAALREALG